MQNKEHFGKNLPFTISTPNDYDSNKSYGIIFIMHGFGASMQDLISIAPMINENDFIYIFPNAPIEIDIGSGQAGYAWFPPNGEAPEKELQLSIQLLNETIVEALSMFNINNKYIYIGGFSQGGMMTIHVGLTQPEKFTGAIILSSRMITPSLLKPHSTVGFPVFMAHGTMDNVISIEDARSTKSQLTEMGCLVEYHEYQMAHNITNQVLDDIKKWIPSIEI
jgi:phospholipase/carboxylesterase